MTPRAATVDAALATKRGWGGEAGVPSAAAGTMDSTLGMLIERLWEGLWAGGSPCPLCEGTLRLRDGAGACDSCGSVLS
ncbi:MAG: hypothetical protein ACJ76Z_10665 [Thermoleophilaceae bacterium]